MPVYQRQRRFCGLLSPAFSLPDFVLAAILVEYLPYQQTWDINLPSYPTKGIGLLHNQINFVFRLWTHLVKKIIYLCSSQNLLAGYDNYRWLVPQTSHCYWCIGSGEELEWIRAGSKSGWRQFRGGMDLSGCCTCLFFLPGSDLAPEALQMYTSQRAENWEPIGNQIYGEAVKCLLNFLRLTGPQLVPV